jgi:hypothetical protein
VYNSDTFLISDIEDDASASDPSERIPLEQQEGVEKRVEGGDVTDTTT